MVMDRCCPWLARAGGARQPLLENAQAEAIESPQPVEGAALPLTETPLGLADWEGSWELARRENWSPYLEFLGVPAAAQEAATMAPDFHKYRVDKDAFTMDHRIPSQGMMLFFRTDISGDFVTCPYPRPTALMWKEGDGEEVKEKVKNSGLWRHTWIEEGIALKTEIPDFAAKGKTVTYERRLVSRGEIKFTVCVMEGDEVIVGPCLTYMRKASADGPNALAVLRSHGAPLKTAQERQAALEKVFEMLTQHIDEFSQAQAADRVSPSRFDGASKMLIGACKYYQALVLGWMQPEKLEDTTLDMLKAGVEADWYVMNEPKGACVVIAPWNAPVLLAAIPMLAMLATGNHVAIKPSEATPTVSALLRRLCQQHLKGYVWVEEGGREAVERLIDSSPDHICFTGGGEIAKCVLGRAAKSLTPCTLELGGKSPVFVDKGLSEEMMGLVVREILQTKQVFAGQFCCAHDYALVHKDAHKAFCATLKAAIEALAEKRSVPLINKRHYERVKKMLQEASGERLPPLAQPHTPNDSEMTLPVTALLTPAATAAVLKEEIFGPLLPVLEVSGVEEAIEKVNAVATGKPLIAYCYSDDKASVEAFLAGTSSGNVAVNAGPQRMLGNFHAGFGGAGASGYGVSMWGREAFREFSNRKHVCQAQAGGFAQSFFTGPPPQAAAAAPPPAAKKESGGDDGAKGQVQKAFAGPPGSGKPPLEEVFTKLAKVEGFAENYGEVVKTANDTEQKLLTVRSMLPFAKREVQLNPDATAAKRAGTLNGYRNFAEKKGVAWRSDAAAMESRGMDVWNAELEKVTDLELRVPDYYQAQGQGTLHSYAKGNCCWEAAFDAPSAYMLVHLHHYPKLTPQESFDQIHKDLDDAALQHLDAAGDDKAPLRCVDIGCGVGTSTFSLRKNLIASGKSPEIVGVDLSPYFIAVAQHLQNEARITQGLTFRHADGLDLQAAGFLDGSLDFICVSEVTHEMPLWVSKRLWREAARALRPGGVVGYLDLNPTQLLRDNAVANLVSRIATMNEPYLDEYLELDMPGAMKEAGLEVLEQTWPAKETWKTAEDASLRIIIARKPPAAS